MKKIMGFALVFGIALIVGGCGAAPASQTNNTSQPVDQTVVTKTANVDNSGAAATGTTTVSNQTAPATSHVDIAGFVFSPAVLTINAGDTVTWTNSDSVAHQIKSATFNSNPFSEGETFSYTFASAGIFDYSCAIHPTMTGKIIVK